MIVLTLEDIVVLALLGVCVILYIGWFIKEIVSGIFDNNDGGDANERTEAVIECDDNGSKQFCK